MINSHFKLIVYGLNGKLRHGRILEQPAVKLVVEAVEAITGQKSVRKNMEGNHVLEIPPRPNIMLVIQLRAQVYIQSQRKLKLMIIEF